MLVCNYFYRREVNVALNHKKIYIFFFHTTRNYFCATLVRHGIMADLDTLLATFQTQLSNVMETVVKTAMFEVTRLVEDNFLPEMKRRTQEVETLKIQLQWAEGQISDQEETHKVSGELSETRPEGQQHGKDKP